MACKPTKETQININNVKSSIMKLKYHKKKINTSRIFQSQKEGRKVMARKLTEETQIYIDNVKSSLMKLKYNIYYT